VGTVTRSSRHALALIRSQKGETGAVMGFDSKKSRRGSASGLTGSDHMFISPVESRSNHPENDLKDSETNQKGGGESAASLGSPGRLKSLPSRKLTQKKECFRKHATKKGF